VRTFYTPRDEIVNLSSVFKSRVVAITSAVAILLFVVGSSAVSGDVSVTPTTTTTTTTTVVEHIDEEAGLIWFQFDDHKIEVSLPD
jgi:hypothetical protein